MRKVIFIIVFTALLMGAGCNSDTRIPNRTPEALKQAFEASSDSFPGVGSELSCLPSLRYDCSEDGCVSNVPASFYFVDYGTEGGTYFRCDTTGCDDYAVDITVSGSYRQFLPKNAAQAMMFKISEMDKSFVDIASVGTSLIISYGYCE